MIRSTLLPRIASALLCLTALTSAQVELCPGGGWTTGSIHTAGTGTNRVLVVAAGGASATQGANDIIEVAYGGQGLTLINKRESLASGSSYVTSLWYLNEAGIDAATNNTISLAVSGPGFVESSLAAATYCNVDQGAPVASSISSQGSVDPVNVTLNITNGNSSLAAVGCGVPGNFTWSLDVSEQTDSVGSVSTFSVADHEIHTSTGNRTARADFSGAVNHNVIVYAELENVTPNPMSEFTGVPFSGPAPLAVDFLDLSTGTVTGWFWTFGDGTTGSVQNPTHLYTTPALYTISLTVFGPGGADLEIKTGILVTEAVPVADFSATPTTGLTPLNVSFTNTTRGGPVTSYAWDFGDGGASTLADPTHTYTVAGTYTVSLTATGPGGAGVETKTDLIMAADMVLANFAADVTSGPAPLAVTFSDLSVGPITSWSWGFGDTNGSTVQNPQHTYIFPGTYSVTLTASGGGDMNTELKTDYITVIGPTAADYSGTPLNGSAPLTVAFTDLSTSNPSSWSWDFGDASGSTQQSPVHIYSTPGTYTVVMTADGPGGPDTETKIDYVVVTPAGESTFYNGSGSNPICFSAPPPVVGTVWQGRVDTSVFPTAVASLLFIRVDSIGGVPTSFGEALFDPSGFIFDNIQVSPGDIDIHEFPLPNDTALIGRTGIAQPLILNASGTLGQFCNAAFMLLGTGISSVSPTVAFSSSTSLGTPPLLVNFTDESTGDVSSWNWDFGDGNVSTSQHPSNAYLADGTYTITLRTSGGNGFSTEIKQDHIVVAQATVADFSASALSGNIPLTVNFSDLSTGANVNAWSWDFGDGGSSSLQNPSYTYTFPGTYTVSLTATGTGGADVESKLDYITVATLIPIPEFSATPLAGQPPLLVSFTDATVGPVTGWSWDFGDGGGSTMQSPTHTYTSFGTFTVSLTALGAMGNATETKPGYIVLTPSAPMADFTGAPTVGSYPLNVSFTDLTSGAVTAWDWNFGDGGSASVQNPTHTYAFVGTYTVILESTGPGGPDTHTKFGYVMVLPPPPVADFSASPTSGEAPLPVSFSDASAGIISSWSWDFGDGGGSTTQNPMHTYVSTGTYTVSLTTSGAGGIDIETKAGYIIATPPPLQDGSFELQAGGMTPGAPWSSISGSANLIHPDGGVLMDNGMPSDGGQWAEISALGTTTALPPSNPGAMGALPIGAATIQQSFGFDPQAPVLAFSVAFLLGDDADSILTNDFMSVDISDGSSTYNIYYADTFSSFPNTSLRYALPMTAVQQVGSNLALLFPSATASTQLTLSISVGNGGDGLDPSTGFVDDFFTLAVAAGTYRNGSGINPPCYVADPPIVGSVWKAHLDSRDRPNIGFVTVLLRDAAVMQSAGPLGELLVGGNFVANFTIVAHVSGISTISLPLPADLSLMGFGTSQGFLVSILAPSEQTLCNAVDFTIGFTPPATRPAADFMASPVTMGPAPLSVSFSDTTSGVATSWAWDFGDGGTASTQNPSHTYNVTGTYTVWLRATGPGGFDIERKFDHIQAQ